MTSLAILAEITVTKELSIVDIYIISKAPAHKNYQMYFKNSGSQRWLYGMVRLEFAYCGYLAPLTVYRTSVPYYSSILEAYRTNVLYFVFFRTVPYLFIYLFICVRLNKGP